MAVSVEHGRLLLASARRSWPGLHIPAVDPARSGALLAVVVIHALALAGLLAVTVTPRLDGNEAVIRAELIAAEPQPAADEPPDEAMVARDSDWQPLLPHEPLPRLVVEVASTAITLPALPAQVHPARAERRAPIDGEPTPTLDVQAVGYLVAPAPRYPPASRRLREEGEVLVRVLIGPDGRPADVSVLRSSGFLRLDDAALEAVRAALFRPYVADGRARAAYVRVPVDFSLRRGSRRA
jgi:protein TonB